MVLSKNILHRLLIAVLIALLRGLRPLLGPINTCPFTIGCTPYAIMQLREQPLHRALIAIIRRLLLCSPFTGFFSMAQRHARFLLRIKE